MRGCAASGLHVLDWLIEVQTSRRGTFTPIGNDGWWTHGGSAQPIRSAAHRGHGRDPRRRRAYEATQDAGISRSAEAAYAWFLGDNDAGLVVADVVTGGCHDGLSADERERKPGRRVDADVADGARDDAPAANARDGHARPDEALGAPVLVEVRA